MKNSLPKSVSWILLLTIIYACSDAPKHFLYIPSNETIYFESSGTDTKTVDILSDGAFNISEDLPEWISVDISARKDNTSTISIAVNPNFGEERDTSIKISTPELEQTIDVVQEAINIVADFDYENQIDHYKLINKSHSTPISSTLEEEWSIFYGDNELTCEENAFMLPYTESNSDRVNIKLVITSNGHSVEKVKSIPIPQTTWYRIYDIGKDIDSQKSNNVPHPWYIDQCNTGQFSDTNCGPACATMALKWLSPDFAFTTEDARNTYLPEGGWWSTNTVMNYMRLHNATINILPFTNSKPNSLIGELDAGNIAILCLDIYYVRTQTKGEEWKLDKFYTTRNINSGHFIVIKGYAIVDDEIFYEVYDPWSEKRTFKDGTPLSCDRLYRKSDITKATNVWWRYAIIVQPPNKVVRSHSDKYIQNIEDVPVQWGK